MKIEMKPTESVCPQLVIYAESEQEQILLRLFCSFNDYFPDYRMVMHGATYQDSKVYSCNIGYIQETKAIPSPEFLSVAKESHKVGSLY